jgi:hypothetical protein
MSACPDFGFTVEIYTAFATSDFRTVSAYMSEYPIATFTSCSLCIYSVTAHLLQIVFPLTILLFEQFHSCSPYPLQNKQLVLHKYLMEVTRSVFLCLSNIFITYFKSLLFKAEFCFPHYCKDT